MSKYVGKKILINERREINPGRDEKDITSQLHEVDFAGEEHWDNILRRLRVDIAIGEIDEEALFYRARVRADIGEVRSLKGA